MWRKQSCIECGFLGWCEVNNGPDGMAQGQAKDEVDKQKRDEIIKSPEAVQSWYYGLQDDSGSALGCYRRLWFHFYSSNPEKMEEVQNEVVKKRRCKHFINYDPSRKPDEHLSLQVKVRDRNAHLRDIIIGAGAVAGFTLIIELIRWLLTKTW